MNSTPQTSKKHDVCGAGHPTDEPVAPDMEAVKSFFHTMLARGAIAELLASIVALLVRMRDIDMELMAKLAAHPSLVCGELRNAPSRVGRKELTDPHGTPLEA